MIARSGTAGNPAGDLPGNPVGLLGPGRERLVTHGRGAPADRRLGPLRSEPLVDPGLHLEPVRIVEPDQPVARLEDPGSRPVVPLQDDQPGPARSLAELDDVRHRRPAESVDRLVVVADDGQVPGRRGDQLDELRLGPIGVLEFVDEDIPEAAPDLAPGGGRLAQQPQREGDLVAEVDEAGRGQQRLVARVGAGELELTTGRLDRGGGGVTGVVPGTGFVSELDEEGSRPDLAIGLGEIRGRIDVLVLEPAEVAGQGAEEAGRITERPIPLELEVEQPLAQEDHDLGPRQDPDVRRDAELHRVVPDQPVPEGVERRDRGVGVAVWDELVDPGLHLGRGLVGEGQGEDLRRPGAVGGDEPGDPPGHDLGLAGSRTGHDQERTVAVGHGPELVSVETGEQRVQAGGCRVGRVRAVADRLGPDRDLLQRPAAPATTGPDHRAAHGRRPVDGRSGRGHDPSMARRRDSSPVTAAWSAPADPRGGPVGQGDPPGRGAAGER